MFKNKKGFEPITIIITLLIVIFIFIIINFAKINKIEQRKDVISNPLKASCVFGYDCDGATTSKNCFLLYGKPNINGEFKPCFRDDQCISVKTKSGLFTSSQLNNICCETDLISMCGVRR